MLNKRMRHLGKMACGKIAADFYKVDQGCNDIISWRQIKATKQGIVQKCHFEAANAAQLLV